MQVNTEDLDKCTLSLFHCFKKANMPNYDYLDICLNFICHEGNIIQKSDNLHHFFHVPMRFCALGNISLLKWKATKDLYLSSLKVVFICFILTALKSKGCMFSSGKEKTTVFSYFECIWNEHMWQNMESIFGLFYVRQKRGHHLNIIHIVLGFSLFWRRGRIVQFAIKVT